MMAMPEDQHTPFIDRHDAGRVLASRLDKYTGRDDVIVLGLPRGGVPVAHEVAQALGAPMDLFLVRKLGTPGRRELAMGAIASGGIRVLNDDVVRSYGIPESAIDQVAREEEQELQRRERAYRDGRPAPALEDRIVILVDDGLATGSTMRAAVQAVRQRHPSRVVVAVPVGARETCAELAAAADEVICARMPEPFSAVGQWYLNFAQTEDDDVRRLLQQSTITPQAYP
jgi:putative phosphoribosyl transferase